ncbi:MAG: hypothetical protein HY033_08660 [Ignavibacteriae bacterium]|nr:hypothetical protein [Ignavibacteria bacterium]MBI3364964.1 hypothetical protein [Ignavibacteriota bacterium]
MVNSKNIGRTFETHRYTLWRGLVERDDGIFIADTMVISMGEHGAMHASPVSDRTEKPGVSESGDRLKDLAGHNVAEIRRAMEEGRKWEMRLRESPLGKTQQDFVAYYAEVIAVFTEWYTAHGIPLPH